MNTLSVVVLTHNEERAIVQCLRRVAWSDETLVLDSFSGDGTLERVREYAASTGHCVRVERHAFEDYGRQRNVALDLARGRWVLFVDADERVTPELAAEVRSTISRAEPYAGYWIPRRNCILGHWMRATGWYPDPQLRLLRKGRARFDLARPVHELAIVDGPTGCLREHLLHYNYDSLSQFWRKQHRYTAFEARAALHAGVVVRPRTYLTKPAREFLRRFLEERGYRDGLHGLALSAFMAWFTLLRYVELGRLREGR